MVERFPGERRASPPAAARPGASPGSWAYHARGREGQPAAARSGQCAPNRGPATSLRQVEQHEEEQVEHQDGARVDDDLHGCQEFRAHEQEYPCDVQEEGENPEHAVDGISSSDGQDRARDAGGGQIVEGNLSRERLAMCDCHPPGTCRIPGDVVLELMDRVVLGRHDPVDEVANRHHSDHLPLFHDRQMTAALVRHAVHTLVDRGSQVHGDDRAGHDLVDLHFL